MSKEQAENIEVVLSGSVVAATEGDMLVKFRPQINATIFNNSKESIDRVRLVWREKGENVSKSLVSGGNNATISSNAEASFSLNTFKLQRFMTNSRMPIFGGGWELKNFDDASAQARELVKYFEIVLGFRDSHKVLWNLFPDGRLESSGSNS